MLQAPAESWADRLGQNQPLKERANRSGELLQSSSRFEELPPGWRDFRLLRAGLGGELLVEYLARISPLETMKDHNLAAGEESLQTAYLQKSVQWEPFKTVVASVTFLPAQPAFTLAAFEHNKGESGTAEVTHPPHRTPISQQCFLS